MSREILVVKKEKLFEKKNFLGFLPLEEANFIDIINKNHEFKERNDDLENNPDYIQAVPYVWLINEREKKVFLYQRALSKGDYKEKRHLNKYSGGIGGHIDKDTEEKSLNPLRDAMIREMREETVMQNYPNPECLGYIYVDYSVFDKVHLGVIAIAKTDEKVRCGDGMAHGDFYSIEEAEEILKNPENEVENWTKVSWPHIKNYLQSMN